MADSILIIDETDDLLPQIRASIPIPLLLSHQTCLRDALTFLGACTREDNPPIILIHAVNTDTAISTCRSLRKTHLAARSLIIVLQESLDSREEILAAGADDYLNLPIDHEILMDRLEEHLNIERRCLEWIVDSTRNALKVDPFGEGVAPQLLQEPMEILSASGVWLYLYDQNTKKLRLQECQFSHSLLEASVNELNVAGIWEDLVKDPSSFPKIVSPPIDGNDGSQPATQVTNLVAIPVLGRGEAVGLLNFGYPETIPITHIQLPPFTVVGKHVENLTDIISLRGQSESLSVRSALVGLIGNLIGQETNPQNVLSITLDHTVPLLEATMGCIWMYTQDGEQLELASSLSTSPHPSPPRFIERGRGLIGWVADHGKPLCTDTPTKNPHFDSKTDKWVKSTDISLIAVPMLDQDEVLGVVAIFHQQMGTIEDQDINVMESIASVTASCIVTTQMIQELRDYADQLSALYEMSQQIAYGLDLKATLNRALQWFHRLVESEVGWLWLVDEGGSSLGLVARMGSEVDDEREISVPLEGSLFGWVAENGKAVRINNLATDPRVDHSVHETLGMEPRNLIALPIIYRGVSIGVVCLVNKVGADFHETDLALLLTAADMIAIAVGNARLHSHTIDLMEERERTHAMALQTARLATMGRLTASFSHEINNPMQAIRGALALALEDLGDEESLTEYIQICTQESDRVIHLINKMRHIYRPSGEGLGPVHINEIIVEVTKIAQKMSHHQGVSINTDLTPNLPEINGVVDQLHLVLLSMVLGLSDAIADAGGGDLTISTSTHSTELRIVFSTEHSVPDWTKDADPDNDDVSIESGVNMALGRGIIDSIGGTMQYQIEENKTNIIVGLPVS